MFRYGLHCSYIYSELSLVRIRKTKNPSCFYQSKRNFSTQISVNNEHIAGDTRQTHLGNSKLRVFTRSIPRKIIVIHIGAAQNRPRNVPSRTQTVKDSLSPIRELQKWKTHNIGTCKRRMTWNYGIKKQTHLVGNRCCMVSRNLVNTAFGHTLTYCCFLSHKQTLIINM